MEYRYPTVMKDGKVTDVIVPVEDFLRMEAAAAEKMEGEAFTPMEVAHAVALGTSPIRAWREHLKLTQEELAKRMGKTAAAVSRLEDPDRKPRIGTLREIVAAFGLEDENKLIKLYD